MYCEIVQTRFWGWSRAAMDPILKVNLAPTIILGLPQVVCHKIPVLCTILLCVPRLGWDWMDCIGLCKNFTIQDYTESKRDCLEWMGIVTDLWTCNKPLNPKNPFTIDKIHILGQCKCGLVARFFRISSRTFSHNRFSPIKWRAILCCNVRNHD